MDIKVCKVYFLYVIMWISLNYFYKVLVLMFLCFLVIVVIVYCFLYMDYKDFCSFIVLIF